MGVRISALVCVQNQDAELAECLRGLTFCDEIVVVADRCVDRSLEIARRAGAEVITGIFPLENQRKLAGLAACTGDWVLEIEADERIDSALAWEIRATLKMGARGDYFEIPIHNYLGDGAVRQGWIGGLGEMSAVRLYRPGAKQWQARRKDAGQVVSGRSAGALKGAIRRMRGRDVGDLVESFNRSTALRAEDLADACDPGRLAPAVVGGLGAFCKSYLVRAGWREGGIGLLLALLAAVYPVASHLKARETLSARLRAMAKPQPAYPREVVGLGAR
ncbi:glycosyltransferase family protein [Phenylobacterium soli]|uniref:Glycosyltransferase family 2 protein n=1 Tax=Phenylobacterium soli TaxID=2170551 RepID=A0A328AIT5_9CAUL|nr:glycosyltransferase family 2 protein [Phenylobacterium soli]RAK54843.1 glycosyltransferase family 2 protein [Phenylobacterium soli]